MAKKTKLKSFDVLMAEALMTPKQRVLAVHPKARRSTRFGISFGGQLAKRHACMPQRCRICVASCSQNLGEKEMSEQAKRQKLAEDASEALCNSNTYGAITALCESSLFLGGRDRLSIKIVRMCKVEQQKELSRYDKAMTALGDEV